MPAPAPPVPRCKCGCPLVIVLDRGRLAVVCNRCRKVTPAKDAPKPGPSLPKGGE